MVFARYECGATSIREPTPMPSSLKTKRKLCGAVRSTEAPPTSTSPLLPEHEEQFASEVEELGGVSPVEDEIFNFCSIFPVIVVRNQDCRQRF